MKSLSHFDAAGRARMVDVTEKRPTLREAEVRAVLELSPEAFAALTEERLTKGDAFTIAKVAGFQAAKQTANLIPLCHSIPIEHLQIHCQVDPARKTIRISARVRTSAKTGVEMEAFVATAIGALTLYDMVKAIDPAARVSDLELVRKGGGQNPFERK